MTPPDDSLYEKARLPDLHLINAKHEASYPLGTPLTHGIEPADRRMTDAQLRWALETIAAWLRERERAARATDSLSVLVEGVYELLELLEAIPDAERTTDNERT